MLAHKKFKSFFLGSRPKETGRTKVFMNCAKKLKLKLKPSSVMNKTKWRVGVDVVVIWSADISFSRKASASAYTNCPDLCLGVAGRDGGGGHSTEAMDGNDRSFCSVTAEICTSRSHHHQPFCTHTSVQFDRARRSRSTTTTRARAGGRHCVTWWGG